MKYKAGDLPSSVNAVLVFYPMLYCPLLYYINAHPVVANYLAEFETNLSSFRIQKVNLYYRIENKEQLFIHAGF